MGQQSHSTGYQGCSTEGPFFKAVTVSQFHKSLSIAIRYTWDTLLILLSGTRIVLLHVVLYILGSFASLSYSQSPDG